MIPLQRALQFSLVVMLGCAVAGCGVGEKRAVVTGRIVDGGKPLALGGSESEEGAVAVDVRFHPLDEAGNPAQDAESFGTSAGPDGSFVMDGADGKGIPVGKYRVVLRYEDYSSSSYSPEGQGQAQGDIWGGRFSIENSPFTFDIQGDQEIELDIASASPASESESESESESQPES